MLASLTASRSVATDTRPASTPSSSLEHTLSTVLRARSAELSERAHTTTCPLADAVAASPHAIAPEPTTATRSSTLFSQIRISLTGESINSLPGERQTEPHHR